MKWFVLAAVVMLLLSCRVMVYKAEQTRQLMGTEVTITVLHDDEAVARSALRKAFQAIEDVNSLMSPYDKDSQVYKLNLAKFLPNPDSNLSYVIKESAKYSELTGGAFDITVQPILDVYKSAARENRTPSEEEIQSSLKNIGYKKVMVNGSITLGANMSITLGGIAKGFAIDQAIEVLKSNGISRALVNAGGDMRAIGEKELGEPWTIALQNPRNKTEYITTFDLVNMSIATSGDYERYYINKSYHHIIDPSTGKSASGLISVTVLAPTAMQADALATSVFVMGPNKGLALIESLDGTEALLITSQKKLIRSSGLK